MQLIIIRNAFRFLKVATVIALIPFKGYAQFELNGLVGIGINSRPYYEFDRMLSKKAVPQVNLNGSINGLYNHNKWQFGVGIQVQRMSRKEDTTTFVYGNPAIIVSLIANRKVGSFYYGLDLGYLIRPQPNDVVEQNEGSRILYTFNGNGLNANLHLGYTRYLGRFGLNGQLNANIARVYDKVMIANSNKQPTNDNYIFYLHYSAMVGVSYKL